MSEQTPKLLYGKGADVVYAAGMEAPDPFLWYQASDGFTHLVLSALEVDRGRKCAKVDIVHAHDDIAKKLAKTGKAASLVNVVAHLVESLGDKGSQINVPYDFPAGLMESLYEAGVMVQPTKLGTLFIHERAIKSAEEIEKLRTAQSINEQAFLYAFDMLYDSEIASDGKLIWQGEVLTSEILRGQMNAVLASLGCTDFNDGPIVTCGAQASDPHERGFGPLYANEFIIIDSFPKAANGYNGDLTRTIIKGEASQWHWDIFNAVKSAQEVGLKQCKAGAIGHEVHKKVAEEIVSHGFDTGVDKNGANFGFFHGTGHSVGLEVHDQSSQGLGTLNRIGGELKAGMVTSVEPGLYYPGKGGCRIEDVVAITKKGVDNLTTLPKELIIL